MSLGDPSPPTPLEYLILRPQTDLRAIDQNGSLLRPQDYIDEEEQGDGPLTPLLPTYHRHDEHDRSLPTAQKAPSFRLALLFLLAAAGVASWVAFDHYAPRGSEKLSPNATAISQDALQHTPSTPSPDPATSAQTSDVLRFLGAAETNEGFVPFEPSIYSPLFPSARPLDPTLSSKAFPSSSCAEQWIVRGELCTAMKGRWTGKQDELQIDVSWTWVNGSSAERMALWRESVSESVGRWAKVKRTVRRKLGGTVLKHFREHDELRYSIRSVKASLGSALRTLHLIVNDYPSFSPPSASTPYSTPHSSTSLLAQVPHWLRPALQPVRNIHFSALVPVPVPRKIFCTRYTPVQVQSAPYRGLLVERRARRWLLHGL